ncbi:MAG: response regulator transcription factor [Dehalococcoidia bacterium]|nr:response regulator transcription factor [Dehalococcoidia bacterium]
MATPRVRILVVADDPLTRAGLASLLAENQDCTVAGQVASQPSLAADIDMFQADAVVWDMGWNTSVQMVSLEELAEPQAAHVIAMIPGPSFASRALGGHARGVLLRDASIDTIVAAAKAISSGLAVIDPDFVLYAKQVPEITPSPLKETLTPREMEILELIAEGLPNKTIAQRLKITDHTVKFHINSLLEKLSAHSRTEAVAIAARSGLILL